MSHSAAPQIITKEIEANEWKKKYEESRQEVLEMRWDPHPVGCCARVPPSGLWGCDGMTQFCFTGVGHTARHVCFVPVLC